jgi:hypothetical protein
MFANLFAGHRSNHLRLTLSFFILVVNVDAFGHSLEENHLFCRQAKDYQGCLGFHRAESSTHLHGEQNLPIPLYTRRRNGDIVKINISSIFAAASSSAGHRYIRWSYLIYYLNTPNTSLPLATVAAPESANGQMVYMYGPVLWHVEADCRDMTANWIGDSKPWINLVNSENDSAKEALSVLRTYCQLK